MGTVEVDDDRVAHSMSFGNHPHWRFLRKQRDAVRKSVSYRVRASQLAKEAAATPELKQAREKLELASRWILMAENEDWLTSYSLSAGEGPSGAAPSS